MSYDNMDVSSQENILIKMIVNTRNNNYFFNPGHPVPGGKDCEIIRFNPLENERTPVRIRGTTQGFTRKRPETLLSCKLNACIIQTFVLESADTSAPGRQGKFL